MKYDWIKSIPEYENILSNDDKWIVENFGIDVYLKFLDHFGKSFINFGNSINSLKKAWAIKNKHIDYNEAARILDVSAKTIYNWRHESDPLNF